eukprot:GHVT01064255.1.p1 GENE.GHVT01064255.1~~GHVT01064255.1.p1  ORF type:complete len:112 (-),score=11.92 GHVT01064255.1:191-526(-)
MFDKEEFLKQNELNKKPFSKNKDLFISELTVKEADTLHTLLVENGVPSGQEGKIRIDSNDYNNCIYQRVSFGLVDENGQKVFTKEEVEGLKDKDFVDAADLEILEINKGKK